MAFNQATADEICRRLAEGESLRSAAKANGMAASTVLDWIAANAEFGEQYARARQVGYQLLADELIEIADDASGDVIETEDGPKVNAEFTARSRLRLDTRKWMLSKMLPKVYGDKLDLNHTGQMAVTLRTDDADA
jgi:hypothetical protein